MVRQMAEPVNVINALIFLISTYYCLASWEKSDELFFLITLLLVLVGYLGHMLITKKQKRHIPSDIKTFIFLTSSIAFLTPLLQNLTVSYSYDTILLYVSIFCIVHCCCYDFQIKTTSESTALVGSTTSLNAIFFAAILLASRLSKISSGFVLLSLNLLVFGFGPYIRHEIKGVSLHAYEALTIVITCALFCQVLVCSHIMAVAYVGLISFICFGTPLFFIYAYSFKNDVRGPWDLPRVKEYQHLD